MDSSPASSLGVGLALAPALGAAAFAAASAAVGALPQARLTALRDNLSGSARDAVDRYLQHQNSIESRWMVLRVTGIALSALVVVDALPPTFGAARPWLAVLGALGLYGIPAEVMIAIAERTADRSAPLVLRVLRPLELLVAPVAAPLAWVGSLVGRSVRRPTEVPPGVAESEVEHVVNEGVEAGALDPEQSEMIRNLLELRDVTAGEVMVPRMRIEAFEVRTPGADVVIRAAAIGHSRYPVYEGSIDNVIGVLHVKDLTRAALEGSPASVSLRELLRAPVMFVPESQSAAAVLREIRARRMHMAVVLDEFGGTAGVVTLEDVLEEIVGDIRDEHDAEDAPIVDLGEGRLLVDATVPIADLGRYLGTALPEDGDYNSVGGFLVERLGCLPRPGAQHSEAGLEFVVREADERRVSKVEVIRPPAGPESLRPKSTRETAA
ncbi:MAG: HlyC/CorC family transporter [Polyangiaceae bacterium]|nr:HlyC/CorC family transporter [Polyangiaceae bacterium]